MRRRYIRGVATVTRLWILSGSVGEYGAGALPGRVEVAARVAAEPRVAPGEALAAWARAHPGLQVAVQADTDFVAAAARLVLGLPGQAIRARSAAIDWPLDPGGRPQLVGLDLDWAPPFQPAGRPRFPGGPGTASSIPSS